MELRFPIGTRYLSGGKCPRLCTIVDHWRTFNLAGELVRERYVSEYRFLDQIMSDADVIETSIAMGIERLMAKQKG